MQSLGKSVLLTAILALMALSAHTAAGSRKHAPSERAPQETGFLNRTLELNGATYKFQVYLPEDYRKPEDSAKPADEKDHHRWPVILFLHGRGERGSEGMWQTQVGLPAQVRDHPERWPFVIVMPQCPQHHFWTDPEMLQMAMASLAQEEREFHTDPDRTYLSGLSLGGYGAWELARAYPHRWAAMAVASTGIFWSYAPDRWREISTLPADYAHAVGRLPIWLFHGSDDTTVVERQSELMYDALKADGGHVRLWVFQGLKHDSWTRAFNEPELPRWLLAFHLNAQGISVREILPATPVARAADAPVGPFAERLVIPLHPPEVKLTPAQLDALVGEYRDPTNNVTYTVQRQGEALYLRNQQGEAQEILAESPTEFFYPAGGLARVLFDRDPQGRVAAVILHDDRFEERLERKR
jgi:acetyl esterase/lipase